MISKESRRKTFLFAFLLRYDLQWSDEYQCPIVVTLLLQ
jgi:hypothetical protein